MNWWQGHGQKWRACPTCHGNLFVPGILIDKRCGECTNGAVCRLCEHPVKQVTLTVDGEGTRSTLECGGCRWRQAI